MFRGRWKIDTLVIGMMPKKSRPYEVGLHQRLQDPVHVLNYVKAAAEDSMEGFLLALRDVADATKGMSELAVSASKNRENLYRMLPEDGNPRLRSLVAVLNSLGLRPSVELIEPRMSSLKGSHKR